MAIRSVLDVLQEVHTHIRIRLVQRQIVYKTNLTLHVRIVVVRPADRGGSTLSVGPVHLVEQMFVIVRLGSQQEVHMQFLQQTNVRSITRQTISHDDQLQIRMFVSNLLQ